MRILVLANVPPGLVGGAEVQALNLARQWAASGHSVLVAGYANQPFETKNLSIIRIRTFRLHRALRAASYAVSTLWLLWRNRKKFDVIYCRFLNEQAFVASFAKIIFRLHQPVIACPACASTGGDVSYISRSPLKHFWTWLLRNGLTAINAMSLQIEQEVISLGINNVLVSRIPNGVILPALNPAKPDCDRKVRFLFVGRLADQKGIDILLLAASHLKNKQAILRIDIIGDGPLRSVITAQIRNLGLVDFVQIVGHLPPDEVSRQLHLAEAFVLPSRYEGMSGALLEAIAHGLPAIVTRVSGSEEIIDDDIGWLVPTNDEEALAEAIREALDLGHGGLHEMGKRARKKAEIEFDIERISVKYLELFMQLTEPLPKHEHQRKSIADNSGQ